MQSPKQSFTFRALNAYRTLRGQSPVVEKEFIRPLSPIDGWSLNGAGRLPLYTDRQGRGCLARAIGLRAAFCGCLTQMAVVLQTDSFSAVISTDRSCPS